MTAAGSSPPSTSARRAAGSSPASSTATGVDARRRAPVRQRRCGRVDGHLRWDLDRPLRARSSTVWRCLADRYPQVESIGIDTWGVDYGLLDADGNAPRRADRLPRRPHRRASSTTSTLRVGTRRAVRDQRAPVPAVQHDLPTRGRAARRRDGRAPPTPCCSPTSSPTGSPASSRTEYTNATTTGSRRRRAPVTGRRAARTRSTIPATLLPPIEPPGTVRGADASRGCARGSGSPPSTVVTTVGSHDTASAVVAVPATDRNGSPTCRAEPGRSSASRSTSRILGRRRRARQLHERGRRRRPHPVPPQRRRALVAPGVAAHAGASTATPGTSTGLLAEADALPPGGPTIDVDDPALRRARRHAGADRARPSTAAGDARTADAGRDRAVHRRLARARLRRARHATQLVLGDVDPCDPHRRWRVAERAAVPAHRGPRRCPGRSPVRSRRPRSATCSCRPARTARCTARSTSCAPESPLHEPLRRYTPRGERS